MSIDFNDPDVIKAAQSAGFVAKTDIDSIVAERNSALEENRNSILEQLKDVKAKYDGVDVESYKKLSDDPRFSKVLTEGFDNYERSLGGELQERLSAQQSDFMLKEQELLQKVKGAETEAEKLVNNLRASELKRKLNMAIVHNEMVDPLAIAEIERDAMDELDLDEKGNIIVKGADGIPKQTAEGPMRETDWLKDMMSTKPYRFRGANGGGNSNITGLTGADLEKMTPAEKIRAARQGGLGK
jgi:hypothetical protein